MGDTIQTFASDARTGETMSLETLIKNLPTKCCGTCRYFRLDQRAYSFYGDCMWPRPDEMPMWLRSVGSEFLYIADGRDCNAWKPKVNAANGGGK